MTKVQRDRLEEKLAQLREKLAELETKGREKMKEQILRNDLHDDLRENEGAKMTMLDHDILQIRIMGLKREIIVAKEEMIRLRMGAIASETKQSNKRSPRQAKLGSRLY